MGSLRTLGMQLERVLCLLVPLDHKRFLKCFFVLPALCKDVTAWWGSSSTESQSWYLKEFLLLKKLMPRVSWASKSQIPTLFRSYFLLLLWKKKNSSEICASLWFIFQTFTAVMVKKHMENKLLLFFSLLLGGISCSDLLLGDQHSKYNNYHYLWLSHWEIQALCKMSPVRRTSQKGSLEDLLFSVSWAG